jgi:FMN phosphatase YigB (HAD superfamily)
MEQDRVKFKAIIFDVYATLLEIGAPPANADALWQRLFDDMIGMPPPFSRDKFELLTTRIIAREHASSRARGIQWPEIQWPSVVLEAMPSLACLSDRMLADFLFRHMRIYRTLRLAEGAAECLRQIRNSGIRLGIASNSQAYTLRELEESFQGTDLSLGMFDPDLCFWSFENGFSKPDPHVFRILTARLDARGIAPVGALMVGDRIDNDIEPARAQGWQTWHLRTAGTENARDGGGFRELCEALADANNYSFSPAESQLTSYGSNTTEIVPSDAT